MNPDFDANPEDARIIGSDQFIQRVPVTPYKPRSAITLQQLAEQICETRGINLELIRSASRTQQLAPVRTFLVIQAIEQRIATLAEVARYLNRDASALGRLVARY